MARNKSVNSQLTSVALTHYTRLAQEQRKLDKICETGNFSKSAIKNAISRGRISMAMITAFHSVIGAKIEHLTGKEPLYSKDDSKDDSPENRALPRSRALSDSQIVEIISLMFKEKDVSILQYEIEKILSKNS